MAALASPSGAYRHLSLLKKTGIRPSILALFVAEARYKYINTSLSSLMSSMLRHIRASTNTSEQTLTCSGLHICISNCENIDVMFLDESRKKDQNRGKALNDCLLRSS
jgi:hypothetical protein